MSAELMAMQAAQVVEKNEGRHETLSPQDRAQQIAIDALEAAFTRDKQLEMSIDNLNAPH